MKPTIIEKPFEKRLYGLADAFNGNAWATGGPLMDKVWSDVKSNGRTSTGINYWYYDGPRSLFVGVEVLEMGPAPAALDLLDLHLGRYAYLKHVGSYASMRAAYDDLSRFIQLSCLIRSGASLEIYGHDKGPGSDPEVEILIGVRGGRI